MADNPPASVTPERRATWRMGARQRERLQWTVVGIICVLLVVALRPYYLHIVEVRNSQICQTNIRTILRGVELYYSDYDDALPIGDSWSSSLQGYLAVQSGTGSKLSSLFHCPKDESGSPSSYAMNDLLSGYSPTHQNISPEAAAKLSKIGSRPDRMPLLFEKHGSTMDAHFPIQDWDELARQMTTPHNVPKPSGWIITGGRSALLIDREKLAVRSGLKF